MTARIRARRGQAGVGRGHVGGGGAAVIGLVLIIVGLVLTLTGIGAIIGIPLGIVGSFILFKAILP